jgi:7-carboxy-7-deazaguanine synthase
MKVYEIFPSIQGESSYAGYPCIFVRLTGCNLRCSYCDTRYAYDEGEELEVDAILDRVKIYGWSLVEVTGGEPLIQEDTPRLVSQLLAEGFTVLMETNGSLDISRIDPRCIRIMDLKCPSSGEAGQNDFKNLDRLTPSDELKFVIGDRDDYEYAKKVIQQMSAKAIRVRHVYFSPVFEKIVLVELANWILDDHVPVRLGLQLHKLIWDPDQRGV